jgi:hypothetical protein
VPVVASATNSSRYFELTVDGLGVGGFRLITKTENERATVTGAAIAEFGHADEATCYEAVFDGNDLETFIAVSGYDAVKVGNYIRAWDLAADWAGVATVAVIINKDDIAAATAYGII